MIPGITTVPHNALLYLFYFLLCRTVSCYVSRCHDSLFTLTSHDVTTHCTFSCLTISFLAFQSCRPGGLKTRHLVRKHFAGTAAAQQSDNSGNYTNKPGGGGGGGEGMGGGMGQDATRTRSLPSMTMELSGTHNGKRSHRPAGTPLRAPAFPTVSFPPSMMLKVRG